MQMPLETKEEKLLKLEKITPEKSLYRILFSNELSILCSEDDMFQYKLYKDAKITQLLFDQLKEKNNYYECLNDAIRIVNTKQYSIKQVKDRLTRLEYSNVDIEEVVLYLEKIKVLDDDEFYNSYVEFKTNQGYGPLYIKNKLYDLGISKNVIFSYDKQYELIKRYLTKRINTKQNKNVFIKKFKNKMIAQGFNNDIINDVINDTYIASDENVIKKDYEKLLDKYSSKYEGYKLKSVIKQKMLMIGYSLSEIELLMEEGV